MQIVDYTEPVFTWVKYDLGGMSLLRRMVFLWKNPPRIRFDREWCLSFFDDEDFRHDLVFPAGFVTDCASIPRLCWFIPGFSPFGVLRPGSIPHDCGYQYGYLLTNAYCWNPTIAERRYYDLHAEEFGELRPIYVGMPQPFFDSLMRDIVVAVNKAKVSATIAYIILKVFGEKVFGDYRSRGPGAYGSNSLGLPGVGGGKL